MLLSYEDREIFGGAVRSQPRPNYFRLTDSRTVLDDLDGWLRHRLRCLLWRQWKRGATRVRKLRALGLSADLARLGRGAGRGPWWNAGTIHMNLALPTAHFTSMGLISLHAAATSGCR